MKRKILKKIISSCLVFLIIFIPESNAVFATEINSENIEFKKESDITLDNLDIDNGEEKEQKNIGENEENIIEENSVQEDDQLSEKINSQMNLASFANGGLSNYSAFDVEIDSTNVFTTGEFTVKIYGVDIKYTQVVLPIWSINNDQDDIVWYEPRKITEEINGKVVTYYKQEVDIKNHKFDSGIYLIHTYGRDKQGNLINLDKSEVRVPVIYNQLSIKDIGNNLTKKIIIKGLTYPGGIKEVVFPTWSEKNNQDDICWYKAQGSALDKLGNGTYSCEISSLNHKNLGVFLTHIYVRDNNNNLHFIADVNWSTSEPSSKKYEIVEGSKSDGLRTAKIKLSGITNPELIKKVQFPTWQKQDQSDIKWYDGQKVTEKDGTISYTFNFDISNHQNHLGTYKSDAYIMDVTGAYNFQNTISFNCEMSASTVDVGESKDGEKTFPAIVKGLSGRDGIDKIQVAVWSAINNQDDIVWYTMNGNNGNYSCNILTSNLKHLGDCFAHFYVKMKSGEMKKIGEDKFVASKPSTSNMFYNNVNGNTGDFGLIATRPVSVSGIKKVEFAVWRDNDQNDIHWYNCDRQADGNYTATANVSLHKHHFGVYHVHCYLTTGNGFFECIGKMDLSINANNYIYTSQSNPTLYNINIVNPNINGTACSKVLMPTWSVTNDQDDIVWYVATNIGNNTWGCTVNVGNHKHSGTFCTHIYGDGNTFLGKANEYNLVSSQGYIGEASHGENHEYYNGVPGDQEQKGVPDISKGEVHLTNYYNYASNGWDEVYRCIDPIKANRIGDNMIALVNNSCFGYAMNSRNTGWEQVQRYGSIAGVKTNCNVDCSSAASLCITMGGVDILTGRGNAPCSFNIGGILLGTGMFKKVYINKKDQVGLQKGDILLNIENHVAVYIGTI